MKLETEWSSEKPRQQQHGDPLRTRTEVLGLHKPEGGGRDTELCLGSELNSEIRAAGPELREWARRQRVTLRRPFTAMTLGQVRLMQLGSAAWTGQGRRLEGGGSNRNATRSRFLTCLRAEGDIQ